MAEDQFAASYDSVKRFIRVLEQSQPLPFRRMECAPGAEVQVDFGQGAWVLVNGKRKRPALVPHGLEPFAQGLQRSGLAADERGLYSFSGKCFPLFWWSHADGELVVHKSPDKSRESGQASAVRDSPVVGDRPDKPPKAVGRCSLVIEDHGRPHLLQTVFRKKPPFA